jgi:hypothetical protein
MMMSSTKNLSAAQTRTLGKRIDALYALDEERAQAQKMVDTLKEKYRKLEESLLNDFDKVHLEGATGSKAMASISRPVVPDVKDLEKLRAHIKKTGEWDLLQNRISTTAVRERWNLHRDVPGVVPLQLPPKLHLTKRNAK